MRTCEFVKAVADYINKHKAIFQIDATVKVVNDSDVEFYNEERILNPMFLGFTLV